MKGIFSVFLQCRLFTVFPYKFPSEILQKHAKLQGFNVCIMLLAHALPFHETAHTGGPDI